MAKELEQIFFANDQQVHKKMLSITNYQGNANQNQNETPHCTCENGYFQKRQETNDSEFDEDVEKLEFQGILVGMQVGAATMENSMEVSQKMKNRTTV